MNQPKGTVAVPKDAFVISIHASNDQLNWERISFSQDHNWVYIDLKKQKEYRYWSIEYDYHSLVMR